MFNINCIAVLAVEKTAKRREERVSFFEKSKKRLINQHTKNRNTEISKYSWTMFSFEVYGIQMLT